MPHQKVTGEFPPAEPTQAEKREALENSLLGRAQADAELTSQGRYWKESEVRITGTPAYPPSQKIPRGTMILCRTNSHSAPASTRCKESEMPTELERRSIAGRLYSHLIKPPEEKSKPMVDGWARQRSQWGEVDHRARGATSPLGGQSKEIKK